MFASIIIDSEKQRIIPNYPLENMSSYNELALPNNTLVCYQTNLPPMAKSLHSGDDKPFQFPCCNNIQPYRTRRLDKEQYFTNFKNSTDSHDNAVFEVKRQINNGPLIDTTYHQIINGVRVQVDINAVGAFFDIMKEEIKYGQIRIPYQRGYLLYGPLVEEVPCPLVDASKVGSDITNMQMVNFAFV